jgi:hypothetical protein
MSSGARSRDPLALPTLHIPYFRAANFFIAGLIDAAAAS